MYNNSKFWILASICFVIFSVIFFVIDKSFSFRVILDIILVLVSLIGLYISNKSSKVSKSKKNKVK